MLPGRRPYGFWLAEAGGRELCGENSSYRQVESKKGVLFAWFLCNIQIIEYLNP
jgi:hypothetical protein